MVRRIKQNFQEIPFSQVQWIIMFHAFEKANLLLLRMIQPCHINIIGNINFCMRDTSDAKRPIKQIYRKMILSTAIATNI